MRVALGGPAVLCPAGGVVSSSSSPRAGLAGASVSVAWPCHALSSLAASRLPVCCCWPHPVFTLACPDPICQLLCLCQAQAQVAGGNTDMLYPTRGETSLLLNVLMFN
ncbi:hypothetical protein Hamer_G019501 [Homarus americanus]|uniref:Uncharacterized protein n=1 Tax=Homarus americanus TaxID=6706 RepID=A0A8J5J015_HOMAM|nr:hypothetical protein Hamer_G019501 [Homarus americanus]